MFEFFDIISKEAIYEVPLWLTLIGACVAFGAILSTFIYWIINKNPNKVARYLSVVGPCAIVFTVVFIIFTSAFCRIQPTGRYKYTATINKDKITLAEYEKFIEEYNPVIKDGVYYWEDKVA